jgi:putative transposase
VLILGEAQFRSVLAGYQAHYNTARPHQGIAQRVPAGERDPPPHDSDRHRHMANPPKPVLGGLINECTHAA